MPGVLVFGNIFLAQLMVTNIRSRGFPNTLTKALEPHEGMDAVVSSQSEGALALTDILDRVSRPQEAKGAQEIVDTLDLVRQFGKECPR